MGVKKFKKRMDIYKRSSEYMIDYYNDRGLLKKINSEKTLKLIEQEFLLKLGIEISYF